MFPTRNRMPEAARSMSVDILLGGMTDLVNLHAQTKMAHWNVVGEQFMMLHELFDRIAEPLPGFVDTIAERITALGGFVTYAAAVGMTPRLPDFPDTLTDGEGILAHLTTLYADFGENLRSAIRMCCDMEYADEVTSNMLQEISHEIDKSLYFLERHVDTDDAEEVPVAP